MIDSELRSFAHQAAPELPVHLLDSVLRATQAAPQSKGWHLMSWLAAATAVFVVLVAVATAAGAFAQRLGVVPPASPTSSNFNIPIPPPSRSASARLSPSVIDGESLALASDRDLFPGSMSAVVVDHGAIVAGGQSCTAQFGCRAVLWRSHDGRDWDAEEPLPDGAASAVTGIITGTRGWVAYSQDRVWFSEDGGHWTNAKGDFTTGLGDGGPPYQAEGECCGIEIQAVESVQNGFVAVGGVSCFQCRGRAAVWLSSDGMHWERLPYTPAFDPGYMRYLAMLSSGRLVSIGEAGSWTSDDGGRTWTSHGGVFGNSLAELAASNDGKRLIAAGTDVETARGGIWRSTDGVNWAFSPTPELDNTVVTALREINGILWLAADWSTGRLDRETRVFRQVSDGGIDRIAVESDQESLITEFGEFEDRLVAVGVTETDNANGQQPAGVWIGP